MSNEILKTKVVEWFKKNKSHRGKWSMIARICGELGVETFPYQWAGRGKYHEYNNEVAEIINELISDYTLSITKDGNAYLISYIGGLNG